MNFLVSGEGRRISEVAVGAMFVSDFGSQLTARASAVPSTRASASRVPESQRPECQSLSVPSDRVQSAEAQSPDLMRAIAHANHFPEPMRISDLRSWPRCGEWRAALLIWSVCGDLVCLLGGM